MDASRSYANFEGGSIVNFKWDSVGLDMHVDGPEYQNITFPLEEPGEVMVSLIITDNEGNTRSENITNLEDGSLE